MEVLKRLFEQTFQLPPEEVKPLQGQLGGSGRAIVRLTGGGRSAIGIVYPVREENVAFLEFSRHFRRHGLPVPEIYGEDLNEGAYLEEDLGDTTLFEFLSQNRAGRPSRPRGRGISESGGRAAAISGGGGARSELQGLLSARELRSAIDRLGSELFQVLLPAAGRRSFQRAGAGARFRPLDEVSAERQITIIFSIAISNRATSCCATGSRFFWTTRAAAKARCNTTLLRCSMTARPTCRRRCARSCSTTISNAWRRYIELDRDAFMEHYYAYVYVRIMQALGAYGFRGFYERKAHFLQSVPYALKNLRWLAA